MKKFNVDVLAVVPYRGLEARDRKECEELVKRNFSENFAGVALKKMRIKKVPKDEEKEMATVGGITA